MGARAQGVLLLLLVAARPATADESFGQPTGGVGCLTLARHAYDEIPALFVAGDPDSLLLLLDRWEESCGSHEVITRARILGAIWDGAFDEALYGANLTTDLLQRADEMAAGDAPDPARVRYDDFTINLAGQLLPHQPPVSLEAFFCLYYAGNVEEAWLLLDTQELAYTSLVYRFDLAREEALPARQWTVGAGFGTWNPQDDLVWVGDKPLVGLQLGHRADDWLLRLVGEWRPGRTDVPYWVTRDDKDFLSDRWDTWLVAGELGYRLDLTGDWEMQLFGGAGFDRLRPFSSDNLALEASHLAAGLGLRSRPRTDDVWIWGMDLRHEWIADRNEDAVNLGGTAWSLRLVVERVFQRGGPGTGFLRR